MVKIPPVKTSRYGRQSSGFQSARYREYLESPEWKKRRTAVIALAGHRCEFCGATDNLEVHHWSYERLGNEDLADLEVLCPRCHEQADQVRSSETRNRQWNARLDGWATKVYGRDWERWPGYEQANEEFEDWINDQDDDWNGYS